MKEISGAIRDELLNLTTDDSDLGRRVWADRAPEGATLPYVSILDAVSTDPSLVGDGRTMMLERLCQVDLWQKGGEEDSALDRAVLTALDGVKLPLDTATVVSVKVEHTERIFEADTYIAHRFFTLNVRHDTSAF